MLRPPSRGSIVLAARRHLAWVRLAIVLASRARPDLVRMDLACWTRLTLRMDLACWTRLAFRMDLARVDLACWVGLAWILLPPCKRRTVPASRSHLAFWMGVASRVSRAWLSLAIILAFRARRDLAWLGLAIVVASVGLAWRMDLAWRRPARVF